MKNVMGKMKFLLSSAEMFPFGFYLCNIKKFLDPEWSRVGALWDTLRSFLDPRCVSVPGQSLWFSR